MTPEQAARYARQWMLPEIGAEGQRRILAAHAAVGGEGLAHEVARRYAERAGFCGILPGEIAPGSLRHRGPRAVFAGARAALAAMRASAAGPQ